MNQDKLIRRYLGHNGRECRVRISKDGSVMRYGSPNTLDRSCDYWAWMGTVESIRMDMHKETQR